MKCITASGAPRSCTAKSRAVERKPLDQVASGSLSSCHSVEEDNGIGGHWPSNNERPLQQNGGVHKPDCGAVTVSTLRSAS